MNALDSPLEALAFNYLRYGLLTVVNNIWTWLAVLTAAVSFWRIRASSDHHPRGKVMHDESCQTQTLFFSTNQVGEAGELPEPEQMICTKKTMPFCGLDMEEISTKGKLTLYYCHEEEEEEEEESEKCVTSSVNESGYDEGVHGEEVGEGWWSKWEMVMKMRKGDDEWYSYQDMTMINGNVVRMWDGCRRRRNVATPKEVAVVGDLMWW